MNGPKKVAKLRAILLANQNRGLPVRLHATGTEVREAARWAGGPRHLRGRQTGRARATWLRLRHRSPQRRRPRPRPMLVKTLLQQASDRAFQQHIERRRAEKAERRRKFVTV